MEAEMDQAQLEEIQRALNHWLKERFADGVRAVLLRPGDDPAIEPGQLMVRVFLPPPEGDYEAALAAWQEAHQAGMDELRRELSLRLPSARRLEFTFDSPDEDPARARERRGQAQRLRGTAAGHAAVGAAGQLRHPPGRAAGGQRRLPGPA